MNMEGWRSPLAHYYAACSAAIGKGSSPQSDPGDQTLVHNTTKPTLPGSIITNTTSATSHLLTCNAVIERFVWPLLFLIVLAACGKTYAQTDKLT